MHQNKNTHAGFTPFWETDKKKDAVDTAALKQSNWYAGVIRNIEASEYEIKKDDKTGMYVAPNRQQQLRSFFTYNSFTLQPRSTEQDWVLRIQLSGIYANKKLIAQPGENDLPVISANQIVFNNDIFSTEYFNSKEGVRQNFIIRKEPAGNPATLNLKLETDKGWYINKVHNKELHFAKRGGEQLSKKITYNSLKVWDANNKELTAKFVVTKKHTAFEIEVNVVDAVYPITIDPLSTTASTQLEINQTNAYLGYSVASAGDVNGDGYSDVIVGAYLYSNPAPPFQPGAAFIFHGSATGISTSVQAYLKCDQTSPQSNFGISVASAGDVNKDGYSDVIVGADNYTNGQSQEGAAFVFHGSATGINTAIQAQLEMNQSLAAMGRSVASAGDVNGDGYSDVIIGAVGFDNGQSGEGAAFVYHGSATGIIPAVQTLLESNTAGDNMGASVACAGDVNGDGYSDIIVGVWAYSNAQALEGAAFIFHGSAAGITTIIQTLLESNNVFAHMGQSVASAGDVNGDGYSDVIAGADNYSNGQSNEGSVYIFHGSATGIITTIQTQLELNQADARLGRSVACAGDVNGDGYSDVIVGAFQYDNGQSNEGAAFVYHGSATGITTTIQTQLESNQIDAQFGNSVASAGDVNGDGYSDVIVGAPNYDNGNPNEGAAFVYHGSPDGLAASPVNTPDDADQAGAEFGWSVASAGDVNGDGYSDVIIGARFYDDGANINEGRAFVYHGSAAGLSAMPDNTPDDANQAFAEFGYSVASAGDVNGDGYSDVIIGAWIYDDGANTDEGRAFIYHGSPTGLSAIPDNTPDDANQASASFGSSVSSAGDINGDGFSDVIIGAIHYDDGINTDEGRAFVYHGSATGLSATPNSTPDDADQGGTQFGKSVASAGDVNGDGFSDVIIGADQYDDGANTNEGRAFLYYGSASGLSASPNRILEDANQPGAWFGFSVASAGDINGDGYSDVIIGASQYNDGINTDEGWAFVYHGSAIGLSATPDNTPDDANQSSANFGKIVASAGDVNGDGYSDVIIGAPFYDDGIYTNEGQAFVYYGSASGLSTTPNSILDDANQAEARFGFFVASAGDVNGDGYSDVITGAFGYDDGVNTDEGRAFVYYGNNTGGLRNNLRLYNQDLVTPIGHLNVTQPNLFGAGLFAKSPLGKVKGRLVWEVKKQGVAFSGNPITNSTAYLDKQTSFTDLGLAGTELKSNVQKVGSKNNKIRTRVEYDKVTAITGQVYGPWRYPAGYTQGAHGMNSIPLPVKLNEFSAALIAEKVQLHWSTADDENVRTYQVERSADKMNFTAVGNISSVHKNNKTYYFTDDHPVKGRSWYRLRIMDEYNRVNFSKTVLIKNTKDAVLVYPTIIGRGETINLQFGYHVSGSLEILLVNSSGTSLFRKTIALAGSNIYPVNLPSLPAGVYILSAMQQGEKIFTQKIIVR